MKIIPVLLLFACLAAGCCSNCHRQSLIDKKLSGGASPTAWEAPIAVDQVRQGYNQDVTQQRNGTN